MRSFEFIVERIETSWIRPWVANAVLKTGAYNNDISWYKKLFKNLNAAKDLKLWKKNNVEHPLKIDSKLINDPDTKTSVLDAEHVLLNQPLEHTISLTVNTAHAPVDDKTTKEFIDRVSSVLVHELTHAHQREQQIRKASDSEQVFDLDTTVWKKQPPKPMNQRDRHYVYVLDNIEKDAWVSQTANDIRNAIGQDSLKYLDSILKQSQAQDYAIVKSKIINTSNLKTLFDAIKYYGKYLKSGKEGTWQKVKKELYGYLSRYDK